MAREWIVTVDKEWRLSLPAELNQRFGERVLLKLTKDRCLNVFSVKAPRRNLNGIDIRVYINKGYIDKRISIPKELRSSTSFYLGSTVKIVEKNNRGQFYIQLQPWKKGFLL